PAFPLMLRIVNCLLFVAGNTKLGASWPTSGSLLTEYDTALFCSRRGTCVDENAGRENVSGPICSCLRGISFTAPLRGVGLLSVKISVVAVSYPSAATVI